jgi:glycosyltransferase involved in cell wall biosynthesis
MAKYFFKCRFQSISDSVYDNELKLYKNPTTKIFNWINNNRFYPAEMAEKAKIRKELGIAENAFVMISVGECSDIKRHSDIIQSLVIIKKSIPTILYIHLGTGKTLENEKKLVRKLDIENSVLFIENQLDVRKFLIASDVYVMTSKFEGISLTTIEAMACRIPTILYNVPGLRDFNKFKTTSFLIPEKPDSIAEKVIAIYNTNFDTNEVIERANQNIQLNYSMNSNVKEIFQLYL